MKNMLIDLIGELQNLFSEASGLDAYDITFERTPNGFTYQAVKKPEPKVDEQLMQDITEFKGYVQTIEDAFFEYANAKFETITDGFTLKDFEDMLENPINADEDVVRGFINLYKNCVKEAVTDYIVELQEKYELNK